MSNEKEAKPAGHFPQQRATFQDAVDYLPGEWRQAAGHGELVRQFLRAAAARWTVATGLQARHFNDHAVAAGSTLRTVGRKRRRLSRRRDASHVPETPTGPEKGKERTRAIDRRPPRRGLPSCCTRASVRGTARSVRGSDARLEEACGLARALDLDVRGRRDRGDCASTSGLRPCSARAGSRRSAVQVEALGVSVVVVDDALSPGAAAESGKGLERQGRGSLRP